MYSTRALFPRLYCMSRYSRASIESTDHHVSRRLYSVEPERPILLTEYPAPGSGHIRIVELNRPTARNALSKSLLHALRDQIDAVHAQYDGVTGEERILQPATFPDDDPVAPGRERGPTRALIVASAADRAFCAGADLKERKQFTDEETTAFLHDLRATFRSLAALPVPTISAISSQALGGGLELALATHFRVLTSNALVALPETRLAIIPGAGGTFRLPALIGVPRARDLILTGRRVPATEAYFLGIADRLVEVRPPEDNGEEEALAAWKKMDDVARESHLLEKARKMALSESVRLALEICEGGPVAVRAALRAVEEPREEVEREMYGRVVCTEDRNEALRAFAEKRKPVFRGK